ncbi:MAG: (Fe-S)-binding protein [Promethearchaeota archaeon]
MTNEEDFPNLSKMRDKIIECVKCAFCKADCVISKELLWESASPRGKMLLLRGLLDGFGTLTEKTINSLYNCTFCDECVKECLAGISLGEVFLASRKDLFNLKQENKLSESLMLQRIDMLCQRLQENYNPLGNLPEERTIWELGQDVELPKTAEIVYFVGCMPAYYRKIARTTFQILKALKVDFTTLGADERCCGSLSFFLGDEKTTKELAKYNVSKIKESGAKKVITSCPGCLRMLRLEYPKILEEQPSFKAMHITELLIEFLEADKLQFQSELNLSVMYHDPCELVHSGIYEQPRKILKAIPGITLVENPDNETSTCCGGGGGLMSLDNNLSTRIAKHKLDTVLDIGVEALVTCCPACIATFSSAAKEYNLPVKIIDLLDLVLQAIDQN